MTHAKVSLVALAVGAGLLATGPIVAQNLKAPDVQAASAARPALSGETLSASQNMVNGQANGSYILNGLIPAVTFHIRGTNANQATSISYTVSDENSHVVTGPVVVPVTTDGSGNADTAPINMPASKLGYYRVDASMADGTILYPTGKTLGTLPPGFITYAVMNNPDLRFAYDSAHSRFGLQDQLNSTQTSSMMAFLGVRWVGYLGQEWARVEPSGPNTFNGTIPTSSWNTTASVTPTNKPWQTYTILYFTAAKIPTWAILSGTCGINNTHMCALNSTGVSELPSFASKYAAAAKAQYPNQTRYYEITWEPGIPYGFNGSYAQLLQFYQLVYPAIHSADSTAVVVGPTMFPNSENVIIDLDAAGTPPFSSVADGIAMHPYETNGWPPELNNGPYGHTFPSTPNHIVYPNLPFAKGLQDQYAILKAAKHSGFNPPMVGTEQGYSAEQIDNIPGWSPTNRANVDLGLLEQAQADVRQTLIFLGEGGKFDTLFKGVDYWVASTPAAERTGIRGAYYTLNPDHPQFGSTIIAPKPSAAAYSAMTWLVDGYDTTGASPPIAIPALTGTQRGYKFTRSVNAPAKIRAMWDYASTSMATIAIPTGALYNIYDWMGNLTASGTSSGTVTVTLGANPIYLVQL